MLAGKRPSHFHLNPIIKAYIVSECFLWAGWNFITPIFAIFATTQVTNGKIELAASAYSVHLVFRVIFELIIGKYFSSSSERKMLQVVIVGILLISVAYIGFVFTTSILQMFLFYSIAGIGFGISSPVKGTIFSKHLDKNKETIEWGITDATAFIAIALASALGGFIAANYGFQVLFILSASINILSVIPYLLYGKRKEPNGSLIDNGQLKIDK